MSRFVSRCFNRVVSEKVPYQDAMNYLKCSREYFLGERPYACTGKTAGREAGGGQ